MVQVESHGLKLSTALFSRGGWWRNATYPKRFHFRNFPLHCSCLDLLSAQLGNLSLFSFVCFCPPTKSLSSHWVAGQQRQPSPHFNKTMRNVETNSCFPLQFFRLHFFIILKQLSSSDWVGWGVKTLQWKVANTPLAFLLVKKILFCSLMNGALNAFLPTHILAANATHSHIWHTWWIFDAIARLGKSS